MNSEESWFFEKHKNTKLGFKVKQVLSSKKSDYQEIKILETFDWGRVLILNGTIMLTERDEFFYHETITHLPLSFLSGKEREKRVLVLGGGDGGSARELLKYPEIKEIKLVEIDQEVIDLCQEFLPFTASSLKDPRVQVHIRDAELFLEDLLKKELLEKDKFDLVISDSSDPEGFAEIFIQDSFYRKVNQVLKTDGIFIQQSSSALSQSREFFLTKENLEKVFPDQVCPAWSLVPTYPGAFWTFCLASPSREKNFFRVAHPEKQEQREIPACRFWKPQLKLALLLEPNFMLEKQAQSLA